MSNKFLFNVYVEAMYQREKATIYQAYARAANDMDRADEIERWHNVWYRRARLMRRIVVRLNYSL